MPRYGPGTKVVLRGLNNMLPDEVKQRSEKDQGPVTRLVLKGLKHALPSIAERNEGDSRKREPILGNGSGKGHSLIFFSNQENRLCRYSPLLTLHTTSKTQT